MKKTERETRQGAVGTGNGTVRFTLYAPGKRSVELVGDWNGSERETDPMECDDEGFWSIEKRLEPGAYTYRFFVDREILICDPYARLLAEGAERDPPRAVVEAGAKPFEWHDEDWRRIPFEELVIYELHVGTFSPERTFRGVASRLGYLRSLGVNCIELLPAYEFSGTVAWGYNPSYFFAVEKSYGGPDDLKLLVDEAHRAGIAVILDLVLAHTGHECPLLKLYPYEDSPWYGTGLGERNQFGFPALDYTKEATKRFVRDVQHHWLREFHMDGFRYDYLLGVGMRGDDGVPHLVRTAREVADDLYLIGEYSPEDPESAARAGLSGAWRVGASYDIKALLGEGLLRPEGWERFDETVRKLDAEANGYPDRIRAVNYIESHDEPRLVLELVNAGMDRQTARKKSALGASLLFSLPGPVMLLQGQEWGEDTVKTQEYNPLHWEYLETNEGRALFEHYARMARARAGAAGLRNGNLTFEAVSAERKTAVIRRRADDGSEVVAAFNFGVDEQALSVPFPAAGLWKDALSGRGVRVGSELEITLGGSEAAVFVMSERTEDDKPGGGGP
jgi:1,4-alpha-glucan branching enzyme